MARHVDSPALLLRSVPYRESDLITTFFTRETGSVSTIVRGARRSQKRFGGALEPIHGLFIVFDETGKDLSTLKEARIERPRTGVTASLEAMEAAGQALRWIRHLCPARTPEPAAWDSVIAFLDALDVIGGAAAEAGPETTALRIRGRLVRLGIRLLGDMGYAIELDRCIRCGRVCPEGRSAFLDPAGGGIVCTQCGGGNRRISGELRDLAVKLQRGEDVTLSDEDARLLLDIVELAMAAHADFDRHA